MPVAHPQIQPFLHYLQFEKRFSQHTIVSYQNDLISFFDYLALHYGQVTLKETEHIFIRSWLAQLKETGITSKTINRKISTLRSFFKYAVKTGVLEQTPMTRIIAPKPEKRLPQYVAENDMSTLVNHVAFGTDWKGQTERLLIMLFYNTGMRLSEVVNLKESNITASGNTIKVLGKGSKERIIPVSAGLMTSINEYLESKKEQNHDNREFLLSSKDGKKLSLRGVYNIVKKYLTLVTTVEKKSPHILRHTFATHLLNGGADLNAVKELLGHSSLASTQVYTHNSIKKLKDAHQKAHPKA
jgi:integrase/recombinase XerC